MMSQLKFILILICLNSLFYFGGKWVPWRIGVFAIERYSYSTPYQIIFLSGMSLIFYFSRNYITNISFRKIIFVGMFFGFVSSFFALVFSYSFFYVDYISLFGVNNLIEQGLTNAVSSWIQIVVFSVMLLGWLYGIFFAVLIYKMKRML